MGFKASVGRHGWLKSVARVIYNLPRRLVTFEFCGVYRNADEYPSWSDVDGYVTRAVDAREFHDGLCAELAGVDCRDAFARGDMCIATLYANEKEERKEVVGCSLYTQRPTRVRPGLEFRFRDAYVYSYGSRTATSHRGKKLESIRWHAAYDANLERFGRNVPRVFYIDVMNLESLSANNTAEVSNGLIGYSGYIGIAGRWFCFRSTGCAREGAGFWRSE